MQYKLYKVGFTDGSEMQVEARSFNHLSNILEIHCLVSGKEVYSVQLLNEED